MAEVESKTNGASEEPNDLEEKIIRQVEYYFGDHNLNHDKFMKAAIKEDDGWVPLETLIKFNRLKILSTDFEVVTGALKKSLNQLMEVSDDGKKVRRSLEKPIPDDNPERQKELLHKTVYAKGFPLDASLDQILEFFRKHGAAENVYMRRHLQRKNKPFKGSVFATFKSKEDADKFVSDDKILYNGDKELLRELKEAYHKRKGEEFAKLKEERKRKKEARQTQTKKFKDDTEKDTAKDEDEEEEAKKFDKGCILYLDGFKSDTSRENIKGVFDNYAVVAWIDFNRGDTEAWVRFEGEGNAAIGLEKAKEANDGKLEIRGAEITARVLEGEEEEEHWEKLNKAKEESRQRKEKGRRNKGGRGGFRGGRNNRGRSRVQEIMQKRMPQKKRFDSDDECDDAPVIKSLNEKGETITKVAVGADAEQKSTTEGQEKISKKTKLEPDDNESTSSKKMKVESNDAEDL